jgi:hypothetical protein
VFANQVGDEPSFIPLLNVLEIQTCQLAASQTGPDENCDYRSIADPLDGRQVRQCQQLFCLFCGKPMAQAYTAPLRSSRPGDACGEFRRDHAVVKRLRERGGE